MSKLTVSRLKKKLQFLLLLIVSFIFSNFRCPSQKLWDCFTHHFDWDSTQQYVICQLVNSLEALSKIPLFKCIPDVFTYCYTGNLCTQLLLCLVKRRTLVYKTDILQKTVRPGIKARYDLEMILSWLLLHLLLNESPVSTLRSGWSDCSVKLTPCPPLIRMGKKEAEEHGSYLSSCYCVCLFF